MLELGDIICFVMLRLLDIPVLDQGREGLQWIGRRGGKDARD